MTYQLQGNYGAILQNFALQIFLKKNGHKPETIQWETAFNDWMSYIRGLYYLVKTWKDKEYHIFPTRPGKFRVYAENGGRRKFIRKNIRLTKACLVQNLRKLVDKSGFDALIVGSDQIWRPSFIPSIEMMFLGFAKGLNLKRIAYAASFGVPYDEFSESQTEECGKLLKDFDAVSVREDFAVQQCMDKFGYGAAVWTPDPTFLIPKAEYDKCCRKFARKDKILFAYILDNDDDKLRYIKSFAEEIGLTVVVKYEKGSPDDTVEEWLSLFRDAVYVVTDSFHGTVFSLIYNKPFTLFRNQRRGNIRLESLSRQMMIDEYKTDETDTYGCYVPDWKIVNSQIEKWQRIGSEFLLSNLACDI